jgi:hypothetical protein
MDANGALNAATRVSSSGQTYIRITIVAQDIPPTNAKTPLDVNGVWDKIYDATTQSIRVVGV